MHNVDIQLPFDSATSHLSINNEHFMLVTIQVFRGKFNYIVFAFGQIVVIGIDKQIWKRKYKQKWSLQQS